VMVQVREEKWGNTQAATEKGSNASGGSVA